MAKFSVHSRARIWYSPSFFLKTAAIAGSSGSSGLGEESKEQTETKTADTVKAGVQLSLRMLRQMLPFLSMFGWYILVLKVTTGGLIGYSGGKAMDKLNTPPSKGVFGGPIIVACHRLMLLPTIPALQNWGGLFSTSFNSFRMRLSPMASSIY